VAVPLVPLLEEHEDAMESPIFRELLRNCGLNPPSNEQVRKPVTSFPRDLSHTSRAANAWIKRELVLYEATCAGNTKAAYCKYVVGQLFVYYVSRSSVQAIKPIST
jgi:hypothetical protein